MATWKNTIIFNWDYQISDDWRIKNLKTNKILKSYISKDGYLRLYIKYKWLWKNYSIHRLVAQTFIPNPNNKPQVNHKDWNKLNNNIENLEWSTAKENMNHAHKNWLIDCSWNWTYWKFWWEHPTSVKIKQLDLEWNIIKIWDAIIEASRELKISRTWIWNCCVGLSKTSWGFIWKYINS